MRGAVTASTQSAADAGVAILERGGNAADAAVAAALATCVADPCNAGLGGYGGYLLLQPRSGDARCVQFPLCAPSNVAPKDLARPYPEAGPACSSVPNVVAGLARALAGFGRLSWAQVSAPAIALAHDGVVANATNARAFELHGERPFAADCFVREMIDTEGRRTLRFRQPRLARTLERMVEHGPAWFYEGPLAELAWRAWREAGVGIAESDWRGQADAAEVVDAAVFEAGDIRIHAAPLGLSGSACVFATFAAAARIARTSGLASPEGLAELATAMARVWQYRFAMPSGNDFTGIGAGEWVEAALKHSAGPRQVAPETAHTAHLNAVDGEGLLAALTFTQGSNWFGGRWALGDSGVVMNCGMQNFSRTPPLRRGSRLYGVSNMTPTVAAGAAGDRVAIGCPGARRIPSNIALVLARNLVGGERLQAAVSAGRVHAEGPERVFWEEGRLTDETRKALHERFEHVEAESGDDYFGPLTALRITAGGAIEAAVDDRIWEGFMRKTS